MPRSSVGMEFTAASRGHRVYHENTCSSTTTVGRVKCAISSFSLLLHLSPNFKKQPKSPVPTTTIVTMLTYMYTYLGPQSVIVISLATSATHNPHGTSHLHLIYCFAYSHTMSPAIPPCVLKIAYMDPVDHPANFVLVQLNRQLISLQSSESTITAVHAI